MVFFAPFALASGPTELLSAPVQSWIAVAYLGVFCSLAAFGLYNTALKLMSAGRAAMAINLIPAVAILAGWLVLGEALSVLQLLACAAIVGAVVFAEIAGRVPVETPLAPLDLVEEPD
jgi:drug/metabolite transporter (DMT)-like permease